MKVIKRSAKRMAVNRGGEGGGGRGKGRGGNKRNSDISGSSPNRG